VADAVTDGSTTLAEAGRRIVGQLAPTELDTFDVVGEAFFGADANRRRAVARTFGRRSHDDPLGFDLGEGAQLVSTVVLVLLNGVACNVISDELTVRAKVWWGWLRRWRLRRALAANRAPLGAATRLSRRSPDEAAAIGETAYRVGLRGGLSEQQARQIALLLTAELMG
jgi:hypothetical protein